MNAQDLIGMAGVPIVIGLVQLVKPFVTDSRFYPPIAVGGGARAEPVRCLSAGRRPAPRGVRRSDRWPRGGGVVRSRQGAPCTREWRLNWPRGDDADAP